MKKWTKESAERFARENIGSNKTCILDGNLSLGKLSAMDYLVNYHGYIYKIERGVK